MASSAWESRNHLMRPYIISNPACMDNLFRSPLIKYRGSWKRGWWVEQIILSTWLLRSIFVQIIVGEHSHGTNACTIFTRLEKFYKQHFLTSPFHHLPNHVPSKYDGPSQAISHRSWISRKANFGHLFFWVKWTFRLTTGNISIQPSQDYSWKSLYALNVHFQEKLACNPEPSVNHSFLASGPRASLEDIGVDIEKGDK